MSVWGVGNTVVIYLAGLQDVPRELYEAAELDGASGLKQLYHVTLPMISPVIFFNLVMAVITVVQVFDIPFMMTQGGPNRASYFYTYYLYDNAFSYLHMGYASALGMDSIADGAGADGHRVLVQQKMGLLPGQMSGKRTNFWALIATYAALIVVCSLAVIPFLWMVSTSLKPDSRGDGISAPLASPPHRNQPARHSDELRPGNLQRSHQFPPVDSKHVDRRRRSPCSARRFPAPLVAYGFARIRFRGRGRCSDSCSAP